MLGPLLPSPYGVLLFASLRQLFLGSLVADSALELAPVPPSRATQTPKGLRPLCFHCSALPHCKSHYLLMLLCVQAGQAGHDEQGLGWTLCPAALEAAAAFPSQVGDHLGTGETG